MEFEGEHFELTEYQIKKTVKAFNYLDKKKKGFLKLNLLGDLLRCCGYNISLKEIENVKELIIQRKSKATNKEKGLDEKQNENQVKGEKCPQIEITEDGEFFIAQAEEKKKENEAEIEKEKAAEIEMNANEASKNDSNSVDENNLSQLLNNLKNYDNFMKIEKEKKELEKQEEENKTLFSLKEFFRVIQIPDIAKEIKPSAVLGAFEIFDEQGNGKISVDKFRYIMQYLGEPFTNAEFDELFEWIKKFDTVCKEDQIIYEDLLNELVNKDVNI